MSSAGTGKKLKAHCLSDMEVINVQMCRAPCQQQTKNNLANMKYLLACGSHIQSRPPLHYVWCGNEISAYAAESIPRDIRSIETERHYLFPDSGEKEIGSCCRHFSTNSSPTTANPPNVGHPASFSIYYFFFFHTRLKHSSTPN